jgi:hypothetical protein
MSATVSDLAPPPAKPSLATRITTLVRDVGNLARDHLELAALEAQRAAIGLTKVLSAAVVVSILVVTAWLSFVASGIVWATDAGVSWPVALCVAGLLNLALAAGVVFWIKAQTGELAFAGTVRQLQRTVDEAREELS